MGTKESQLKSIYNKCRLLANTSFPISPPGKPEQFRVLQGKACQGELAYGDEELRLWGQSCSIPVPLLPAEWPS